MSRFVSGNFFALGRLLCRPCGVPAADFPRSQVMSFSVEDCAREIPCRMRREVEYKEKTPRPAEAALASSILFCTIARMAASAAVVGQVELLRRCAGKESFDYPGNAMQPGC